MILWGSEKVKVQLALWLSLLTSFYDHLDYDGCEVKNVIIWNPCYLAQVLYHLQRTLTINNWHALGKEAISNIYQTEGSLA